MPIEFYCDHERRIVFARAKGILTDEEVFSYQKEVWSREDTIGYDEVIDMSGVEIIASKSGDRMRDLATLSASMDSRSSRTKFAIVAPDDLAYGMGRMYETYRTMDERSTREVAVFRGMEEAMAWIDQNR